MVRSGYSRYGSKNYESQIKKEKGKYKMIEIKTNLKELEQIRHAEFMRFVAKQTYKPRKQRLRKS